MTAEVAILNKRAIALAADSAVTITSWKDGKRVERYVKGANKIFEFSEAQPVGVMIFNASAIHSVPWELVIKSYRSVLGLASSPHLVDYAQGLFDYLQASGTFFPSGRQDDTFKSKFIDVFIDLLVEVDSTPSVIAAKGDPAMLNNARNLALAELAQQVRIESLPSHFTPQSVATTSAKFRSSVETSVAPTLAKRKWIEKQDDLIDLSFEVLHKRYKKYLDHTGLVIAGYGEADIFPGYVHFDCYGILDGKLVVDKTDEGTVTFDDGAKIQPFAMSSMAETFMLGLSPDIFSVFGAAIKMALETISKAVEGHIGTALPPVLTQQIADTQAALVSTLMKSCISDHYEPLTRAIGSLPIDEMANLAETMIMLESLKEKVTRPSESVGGAVDVAVITKSEGLVWIKRKHFFSPDLNPKFFERQKHRIA